MARQRLPLVQFPVGDPALTVRIGLTKGSLRPAAPISLAGAFFSGAAEAVAGMTDALTGLAGLVKGFFVATAFGVAFALGAAFLALVAIGAFFAATAPAWAEGAGPTVLVVAAAGAGVVGCVLGAIGVVPVFTALAGALVPAGAFVPGLDLVAAVCAVAGAAVEALAGADAVPFTGVGEAVAFGCAAPVVPCPRAAVTSIVAMARILISFIVVPFTPSVRSTLQARLLEPAPAWPVPAAAPVQVHD